MNDHITLFPDEIIQTDIKRANQLKSSRLKTRLADDSINSINYLRSPSQPLGEPFTIVHSRFPRVILTYGHSPKRWMMLSGPELHSGHTSSIVDVHERLLVAFLHNWSFNQSWTRRLIATSKMIHFPS